jgi:HlyD family secretion protein
MTFPWMRILIGVAIAAAVAGGLYWLFSPKPILVETAQIGRTTFYDTIEQDGRTRVRDRFLVSAPLSGRLQRIALNAGDVVEAGQTLATIVPAAVPLLDPRSQLELEAQVGVAEASLEEASALHEQARLQLEQASVALDRTRQLFQRGVVPRARLDTEEFQVQSLQRQVDAAERRQDAATHVLEQARAALVSSTTTATGESFAVAAPISGLVLDVMQDSEGVIAVGSPLMELGDLRDMEVIVDVLTTDAARIAPGDEAMIINWGGGHDLEGVVRRIEPSGFTKVSVLGVEEQRVWVEVDITSPFETWTSLGDGFRADVQIVVDRQENATVAPVGALFRRDNAWAVFVVEDGVARLRNVEIGRISQREAAVLSGLVPGDVVVIYPPASLKPDAAVRLE